MQPDDLSFHAILVDSGPTEPWTVADRENSASSNNCNSAMPLSDDMVTYKRKRFVSGLERWTLLRTPNKGRLTFWSFVDACLLTLDKENRRLHIEGSRPEFPLTATFTSESPVTLDSSDRGKLLRNASMVLSDVTFLLMRNFEEFELTILSIDLQSRAESEIKTPRWAFEELEDVLPTLRDAARKRKEFSDALKALAKKVNSTRRHDDDDDDANAEETGIRLLLHQFERISCDPWTGSSHVGCLLFHELSFKEPNYSPVNRIRAELPRNFLSIDPAIDLRVNDQKVPIGFYQRRLAELTRFDAVIDSSKCSWRPCEPNDDVCKLRSTETIVHLFIGFDIMRCTTENCRDSSLIMMFVGKMGLLSGVRVKQVHLSTGCGLATLVLAPGAPAARDRSDMYYIMDESRNGRAFLNVLEDIVLAVGTGYTKHYLSQSQHSVSNLVKRIAILKRQRVDDPSLVEDILPNSTFNTFSGWKYEPKSSSFADGYVVEVGADTLLHLAPSTSEIFPTASAVQKESYGSTLTSDTNLKRARPLEIQMQMSSAPGSRDAGPACRREEVFLRSSSPAARERPTVGMRFQLKDENRNSHTHGLKELSAMENLKWYESALQEATEVIKGERHRNTALRVQRQRLIAANEELKNRLQASRLHDQLEQCKRENRELRQQVSVLTNRRRENEAALQRASESYNSLAASHRDAFLQSRSGTQSSYYETTQRLIFQVQELQLQNESLSDENNRLRHLAGKAALVETTENEYHQQNEMEHQHSYTVSRHIFDHY